MKMVHPLKKKTSSIGSTYNKLNKSFHSFNPDDETIYFVENRKGGRRGTGPVKSWLGVHRAHNLSQGVSGTTVRRCTSESHAFEEMEKRFPGVNSWEALRAFHMTVPHTETNLSPTYSPFRGQIHHPAPMPWPTPSPEWIMIILR
jgi:hypothetical protein